MERIRDELSIITDDMNWALARRFVAVVILGAPAYPVLEITGNRHPQTFETFQISLNYIYLIYS